MGFWVLLGQGGGISKQFGNKIHAERIHIFKDHGEGKKKDLANTYKFGVISNLVNWKYVQKRAYGKNVTKVFVFISNSPRAFFSHFLTLLPKPN